MATSEIPIIDIAPYFSGSEPAKLAVARQIDAACRALGFLVIRGHGVSPELVARTRQLTRAFFDLPLPAKQRYRSNDRNIYRGYFEKGSSALSYSIGDASAQPDYRETFTTGRPSVDPTDPYYGSDDGRRIFVPNIVPAEIPELGAVWAEYYGTMEGLAQVLMRLFAIALDLGETWFDDKIDKHMTLLDFANYPDQLTPPMPNQVRAGAHTDYGSLTILKTEDKPGGLEVLLPEGRWITAPVVNDAFIVNIGDLMAQWTNDEWVSTMHRVVNPPRDLTNGTRRLSMIFFHQPNYDAVVECLPSCARNKPAKYSPTTSGAHLISKSEKAFSISSVTTPQVANVAETEMRLPVPSREDNEARDQQAR